MDNYFVGLELDSAIRVVQMEIGKIVFDEISPETQAKNEPTAAIFGIDSHDMPQDRVLADWDHRLGPKLRFFFQARPQSAAEKKDWHLCRYQRLRHALNYCGCNRPWKAGTGTLTRNAKSVTQPSLSLETFFPSFNRRMSAKITTTIPVRNGQQFILQTLESVARQTRRPDRVVVLDNCSTDSTPEIVRCFKAFPIDYIRNPRDLGLFGNLNRCLEFSPETDFLHILHADDLIKPGFYEKMSQSLADCSGLGMAWCLDDRIDQESRLLSTSGKADGSMHVLGKDEFLARKAEISNQAFCATLLRTNRQPAPAQFPTDMPILGDMVYWARFGSHCQKIVTVNEALAEYRWHGGNETVFRAPSIDALVTDEWRTMQEVEQMRNRPGGTMRWMKLRGLLAVRAGIKAKRIRQLGQTEYSREIIQKARGFTGLPLWLAGQMVVETRELLVFKLGRRPRHRQNIFS